MTPHRLKGKGVATTRLRWLVLLAVLIGVGGLAVAFPRHATMRGAGWSVGQLRPDGLRIVPSGRSDASAVLDPDEFASPTVRHAYWIATQIPATLNQLYCWCGCENRGVHRSNLQCFEDQMGKQCDVCQGTAEIAYLMTHQGVTDAGSIQAAVDARWAPRAAS